MGTNGGQAHDQQIVVPRPAPDKREALLGGSLVSFKFLPIIVVVSLRKWLQRNSPRRGLEEMPQEKDPVLPQSLIVIVSRVSSTSSASRPSGDGHYTGRGVSSSGRMSIRTFRRR